MRIGFDASQTGPGKAGCGYYADGLLRALTACNGDNDYIIYPTFGDHFYDPYIRCDEFANFHNVRIGPHHTPAEAKKIWGSPPGTFESDLGQPDIVHANNFFAPRELKRARLVFTLYDLNFLDDCSWTTEANRTTCFEGVFRASISADWIVAISEHTRQRFTHFFPHYPQDRISVVYPGSKFRDEDPKNEPPAARLRKREFWLCVGTIEPRKNYSGILAAYAELRKRAGSTYPLVIAGGAGWMMNLGAEIEKLNLGGSVISLGYVSDAVLCWLYRNTTCLIFPSLYEGFGMPVLEAMSCGSPAIASTGSAFGEIIADFDLSQLLVDPLDPLSICNAMQLVQGMSPVHLESLGRLARQRAEVFSWTRSAQFMLEIYRRVASSPKLFA